MKQTPTHANSAPRLSQPLESMLKEQSVSAGLRENLLELVSCRSSLVAKLYLKLSIRR